MWKYYTFLFYFNQHKIKSINTTILNGNAVLFENNVKIWMVLKQLEFSLSKHFLVVFLFVVKYDWDIPTAIQALHVHKHNCF